MPIEIFKLMMKNCKRQLKVFFPQILVGDNEDHGCDTCPPLHPPHAFIFTSMVWPHT